MDVKLTRILVFIIGDGCLEEEAIEVHIIYLCLTFTLHRIIYMISTEYFGFDHLQILIMVTRVDT